MSRSSLQQQSSLFPLRRIGCMDQTTIMFMDKPSSFKWCLPCWFL